MKHLLHSSLQFYFLKRFHFLVFTFGNRRGEKQFSANGLNLFSISKSCLPLEHLDARPPISSRNTTEVVMGLQLLIRARHSSEPSLHGKPGMFWLKGIFECGLSCCQGIFHFLWPLTSLLSRFSTWNPPLWQSGLENTRLCLCVCACVCVQTFVLYRCSLGGGENPSWRCPFLRSLHSHQVSVMSFLCHPHHAMQLLNSFPVPVSPQCKECLAGEVLSVWCALSPEPLLPPWVVVWALCFKMRHF